MHKPAVDCTQISKAFGATAVVQDVSFAIQPGRILALLGPSGCGKTTTLRLIAGFETLDSGSIDIGGQHVAGSRLFVPPEKRRVGMVFQDYAIFPHLSVGQNIAFGLGRGEEAVTRTATMLQLVGLAGYGDKMPHELSGGQQQRVALARALALEPAVVLLDEPFSNLDTALRATVRREVRDLLRASHATAIFVTHDQEEAMYLGDEIAVMNGGRLEQVGTPEAVFHQPQTRFVAEFMGQTDFVPGETGARGVQTALGTLPPVAAAPGTAVAVAVRPDDVALDPATNGRANGRVVDRQFIGIATIYRVALDSGVIVHSWQPHDVEFAIGTAVCARFGTDHRLTCFAGDVALPPA